MADLVVRGGKLLVLGGELVTNNECCCDPCFEDCGDESIAVTLPDFTTAAGCDNCEDIPAGPHTLAAYTPGSPTAGCCYWKLEGIGEAGECGLEAIYVEACISGVDPDKVVDFTVEIYGPDELLLQTFYQQYDLCDLCELLPGSVDVEAGGGDCDTAGVAEITFASACCQDHCCDDVCSASYCDGMTPIGWELQNITGFENWFDTTNTGEAGINCTSDVIVFGPITDPPGMRLILNTGCNPEIEWELYFQLRCAGGVIPVGSADDAFLSMRGFSADNQEIIYGESHSGLVLETGHSDCPMYWYADFSIAVTFNPDMEGDLPDCYDSGQVLRSGTIRVIFFAA